MIDPKKVTDYNRNEWQLQEFLIYCVCVAGKKSEIESPKVRRFCMDPRFGFGLKPFELIRKLLKVYSVEEDGLMQHLKKHKIAPYQQRYNSLKDIVTLLDVDLNKVTIEDLQKVRGISTKTSRFFLTHSREDFDEPVLDTHILRFLTDFGYQNVPKSTPQNPKVYEKFSEIFKSIALFEGKSVTDFDLEVWTKYSYGN
jgi:thermostable 8-oxoguanine DNA glycosylase|tara:strand:+ start:269 stop:862 length:594 start_codon:yes stop_codon:yes gene_type:complete